MVIQAVVWGHWLISRTISCSCPTWRLAHFGWCWFLCTSMASCPNSSVILCWLFAASLRSWWSWISLIRLFLISTNGMSILAARCSWSRTCSRSSWWRMALSFIWLAVTGAVASSFSRFCSLWLQYLFAFACRFFIMEFLRFGWVSPSVTRVWCFLSRTKIYSLIN